ncbi:PIG-L family deacetylase [Ginsengibacter hankyongi]|uniref:PIG-L family deacetylase n=1 Tax=Ginsengibacter hankyongi TaxID=2607284 RepID=A0A5J5II93_9BACT|nr:PIG-L family deacetylase [Ginsengibacter hankyongi]KAA9040740.1 PIG-L family deacetylase [Ginsengibacter hankyongi]
MRKIVFLFFTLHLSFFAFAQSPETYTSSEVFQQIKKLNVLASVLYVGAHPDDENNALLPYFAKEKLWRTAYLSLTRGDGGQNLIGDEQGIELGLIRTQELLAARRVDGAEQYFTRAYEFGFSKSAAEALRIWDKEKILSDVVWVIRKYQPDVIIKRFPPDKRAGHGHHAASSILAQEAFTAAADPTKFPEQFKYGVKPWQAKRILWNTYNFGGNNTTSEDQLKIDIGGYNPLIGKSYGELGGEARTMHKSQGEGRPRRRGESYEYFATTGGEAPKNDLMDGIVTDWKRIPGGEPIESMINAIISNYNIAQPDLSVPSLVKLYQAIKALPEDNWRNKKLDEVEEIIIECSALYVEATSSQSQVVQGGNLSISFNLIKRENVNVSFKNISVENFDSSFSTALPTNQNVNINKTLAVADDKKISQPYWLVYPLKGGTFDVRDQTLIGKAENAPSFEASFLVNIDGEDFTIKKPVQYRYIDPVKGDTYEPIPVLPKIELSYTKDNFISLNGAPVKAIIHLKSNLDNSESYKVLQDYSKNWATDIPSITYDTKGSKEVYKTATFTSKSNETNNSEEIYLKTSDGNYNGYTKTISYNHIPTITYFPEAKADIVKLDIKIVGKKIGYIIGAGDKVPDALKDMGYDVTTLSEKDITDENLKRYDAIMTGIRAYNLYEYLSDKNDVLMRYVKNGGNMIVQYMKSNQVGDKNITVGPYPFKISSGSRVTEEDAKVNFLLPANPALNYPNKITEKDFEGWVQERSTYQAVQLDSHYETPLGMHDADEEESNGSLAIAKYGKGNFVYASLVFFRQLPDGVPGAYRLMANLIALPKNK